MIRVQGVTYPTDELRTQTTGRSAKPSARFVVSRTSLMTLFITPVVSLIGKPRHKISPPTYIPIEHSTQTTAIATFSQANAPLLYDRIHLITKVVNVREMPKQSVDKALPIKPIRRTGFRPIRCIAGRSRLPQHRTENPNIMLHPVLAFGLSLNSTIRPA